MKKFRKMYKKFSEWNANFSLDYFVYLMRFLICVHIIAGERGVYKDVSENS